MVAKTWSPTFNLRERLNEFREELATVYYDDVPNITILQCVAGVLTKAVRRKDILNIGKAQIQEHWDVTLESIRQAIDFLTGRLTDCARKNPPLQLCHCAPDVFLFCC